jgi:hypothetical protein
MSKYINAMKDIEELVRSLDQPINYKGTLYILEVVWFTNKNLVGNVDLTGSVLLSVTLLMKNDKPISDGFNNREAIAEVPLIEGGEVLGYKKAECFMFIVSR